MNQLYWSFVPVAGFCSHIARHQKPNEGLDTLFHASGPDLRRLAPTNKDWQLDFSNFGNWVRLNVVVAISSYLEVFMRAIISAALKSDPAAPKGNTRAVDGAYLLKREAQQDFESEIKNCVVGEWQSRVAQYRRLFKNVPSVLEDSIGELERIRIFRNSVGHTFGRDVENYEYNLISRFVPMQRLQHRRMLRWLGLIEDTVRAIENHLLSFHIA